METYPKIAQPLHTNCNSHSHASQSWKEAKLLQYTSCVNVS